MKKSVKFSPEVRERAVRMVGECRGDHPSQWAAADSIAAKVGCTAQTLLSWVRQHARGTGQRKGPTTADQKRVKELGREVCERRRANEILTLASALFAQAQREHRFKS
jgi:transposase